MNNYIVYWYKTKEQTNPYTEGYIGITNNIERRDKEHRRNSRFSHFTNAMKLYDDIHYEILADNISIKEASDMEYHYRPDANIGWNSAPGGVDVLRKVQSTPITMYHESEPLVLHEFESIAEASKKLGISSSRIRQANLRKNPHYGYDGWAILFDNSIDRMKTISIRKHQSSLVTGTKRAKPSHYKGMTDRWSEEDKLRIGKQHKGKTISEKQRETVRLKNRASHSSCVPITLIHIDNSECEHTYHSISEASRQLGIPLSTLKSRAQRSLLRYGKDGWAIKHLGSE